MSRPSTSDNQKATSKSDVEEKNLVVAKRFDVEKKTSLEDLEEHGFKVQETIGEGSYCKVRAAEYKGQSIAVKVISRKTLTDEYLTKSLPRKLEILSWVRHENIVRVHRIFSYPDSVYIFMERIDGCDMLTKILEDGAMTEDEARFCFVQLLDAVRYLHDHHIAHRDLKCENVMLTSDQRVKLIDFGFSRSAVDATGKRLLSETFCGSTAYAAPELIEGTPYNPMLADSWSLGCILFVMLTGQLPFDDSNPRAMVLCQKAKQLAYPKQDDFQLSWDAKRVISSILEPDVLRRATIRFIQEDPWVNSTGSGITGSVELSEFDCASVKAAAFIL